MNERMLQSVEFWKSFGGYFPASVVIINKRGIVIYENDIFRKLIGINSKNLFRFMDDDCSNRIKEAIVLSKNVTHVLISALKIKKSNEKIFYFTAYLFPLDDDFICFVLTDITDLNNSLQMLNNIVNTVPDPVFVKDDQFRFLYLNQACTDTWGLPISEILGKSDDGFFPKEETDVFNKIDRKTFRSGKTTINEEKFTRVEGNTRIISTKKSVFKTLTGSKILVGVSRDVTEINKAREYLKKHAKELQRQVYLRTKQLEIKTRDLEKAVDQLKSLNSDLDYFAHICCHELREPLRAISSFSKLALDEHSSGKNNNLGDFLQIIQQGSLRMDKLIKSILEYSTNGLSTSSMSLFSSNDLIVEVITMLKDSIQEKGIQTNFSNMPFIYADRLQIIQLFQNLINNSIKFSSDKVSPVINISAEQKGKFVEFQVQDNGIGIAKKYHKEIFLPFKKFHSRSEGSAHGIGLSLCKKIVENHGGSIKISSAENVGTTFKFLLPSQAI